MGAYSQLKLMLWKNVVLRLRQPVILALELLWPITVFLLVLLLRKIVPPIAQETCYYNARALPSAGGLHVLQSLICNVENKCLNQSMYEDIPSYPGSRVSELVDNLSPLVKDPSILSVVKSLPVLAGILRPLESLFDDESVQMLLDKGIPFVDVVRSSRQTRHVLLKETNMTDETVDLLFQSRINIPSVFHFLGTNHRTLECDVKTLRMFLIVENDRDLLEIFNSLCPISEVTVQNLKKEFQSSLDYGRIVDLVSNVLAKLGLKDVGFAGKQVAGMISAFVDIAAGVPPEFTASMMSVKDLVNDVTDGGVDLGLVKNVWSDFSQLVPLQKRKSVDDVIKLIAGNTEQHGPGDASMDAPLSRRVQPFDKGTVAKLLNSTLELASMLQGSASSDSGLVGFLRSMLDFDGGTTLSDVVDSLGKALEAEDESRQNRERIRRSLVFAGQLLGITVEFARAGLEEKNKEDGGHPLFPAMLESLVTTFTVPRRINRIVSRGLVNTVCHEARFKSVFIAQDNSSDLQNFTCRMLRDIFPAALRASQGINNRVDTWDPLSLRIADIASFLDKAYSANSLRYDWSRLSKACEKFLMHWNSKETNKRIALTTTITQVVSDYVTTCKLKFWNDFVAVFYMADQIVQLLNQQLESVLKEGAIQVHHIALEVPSLGTIISDILEFLPDFIRLSLRVLQTDLGPLIEKLERNKHTKAYVPCRSGTFADLLTVENRDAVRKLEQKICQQIPLLLTQFFVEPHVEALSRMFQDVHQGREVALNWVNAGSHVNKLLEKLDRLRRFEGTIFPDVPTLHGSSMKDALSDARIILGLDDSPLSKTTAVLQMVSIAIHELDARLNHTLAPYLIKMAAFLSTAENTLLDSKDGRERTVTDVFKSVTDVDMLVRWIDRYLVKFMELFFNTLSAEPRKISRILKEKDGFYKLCTDNVGDYLSVPLQDQEIANSALSELCRINFTAVHEALQGSENFKDIPVQRQTDWFFKTLRHIVNVVQKKTSIAMSSNILNGTQWRTLIADNFGNSSSTAKRQNVLSILKGVTVVFENNTAGLESVFTVASKTACMLKAPFQILKWKRLLENNVHRRNIYSILKLVNGSIDVVDMIFDTIMEPKHVKAIVQSFGTASNDSQKICSLSPNEWTQYFVKSRQDAGFPEDYIHHIACEFSTSGIIDELTSNCEEEARVSTGGPERVDRFYENGLAVYDELTMSFTSPSTKGVQFLDTEEWLKLLTTFQYRLRNGLLKMDLGDIDTWLSLLQGQLRGKDASENYLHCVSFVNKWIGKLNEKYKGSSDIMLEEAFGSLPHITSFLKLWLPLLPTASESLMSALIVQHKAQKSFSFNSLSEAQERICSEWNATTATSESLEQYVFVAAICGSNFSAVIEEIKTESELNDLSHGPSSRTVGNFYEILRRVKAKRSSLTGVDEAPAADGFPALNPWEILNIQNALQSWGTSEAPIEREIVAMMLQWKENLRYLNTSSAWETLDTFAKSALQKMKGKNGKEELLKYINWFNYSVSKGLKSAQDVYATSNSSESSEQNGDFNCSKNCHYALDWIAESSEWGLESALEKVAKFSERIVDGYGVHSTDALNLVNDEQMAVTVMNFMTGYAHRPTHSAIRLLLSLFWTVHVNMSGHPTWNYLVPPTLDAVEHLNAYLERTPSRNAFVANVKSPACDACESLDPLEQAESLLRDLVSKTSSPNPEPLRFAKILHLAFNVTDAYSCSGRHQPPFPEVLKLVRETIKRFPGPNELFCTLPNMTATDAYKWLSETLGLQDLVGKVISVTESSSVQTTSCTSIPGILADCMNVLEMYIDALSPKKRIFLEPCLEKIYHGVYESSTQKYFTFAKHTFEFVQSIFRRNVANETILTFLLNKLQSELPVYARLSEVVNRTKRMAAEDQPKEVSYTDELMNSKINLNWLVRHNFSQESFLEALCSDPKKGLFIKEFDVLKHDACSSDLAKASVEALSDITKLYMHVQNEQKRTFDSGAWLQKAVADAPILLRQVSKLISSSPAMSLDVPGQATLSTITALFNKTLLENIIDSMSDIQASLDRIIPGGTVAEHLALITKGLEGFLNLLKTKLFDLTYNTQDIFANKNEAINLLTGALQLTTKEVENILHRRLDLSALLKSGIRNITNSALCNVTLDGLPRHGGTSDKLDLFCSSLATSEIMYRPLSDLVTSKFLKNFLDVSFEGIFGAARLSREVVASAFKDIGTAPTVVPEIRKKLSILAAVLDPRTTRALSDLNITSGDGISVLTSPAALKLVGTLLCGMPLKALEEHFHFLQPANREPTLDAKETEELPSQFCRRGYEQVMHLNGGPIIWGLLKPILKGQILYSPKTPASLRVMQQVNRTFDSMSVVIDALSSWSKGTSGLKFLTQEGGVVTKLKAILASESMQMVLADTLGKKMHTFLKELNVDDLRHEFGDLGGLLGLVELVGSISECFELDRFVGFDDEAALEEAAMRLKGRKEFISAVVFLNLSSNADAKLGTGLETDGVLPRHVQYKIRMDIDNVPLSRSVKRRFWIPGPNDNFLDDLRYLRGFSHFQELIDRAIIELHTGHSLDGQLPTYLQQFPYPCYVKDTVGYYIKAMLPLIFTLSWIFLVAFFVRERVLPRELHLEEIMQVMGLRPWVDWTAWFLTAACVSIVVVLCNTVILSMGGILPSSDPVLLFVFYATFALSVITYCYMISIFFRTATVASLTGIVGYLISFLPFVIAVSMEANLALVQKLLLCLSMSTSFSYGCLYVSRYEEQGLGVQWEYLWSSPIPGDDMKFGYCIAMMLFDSLLYLLISLVVSALSQRNKSFRNPWNFLTRFSSWRPRPSKLYVLPDTLRADVKSPVSYVAHDWTSKTQVVTTGISIRDLSVTYNTGKKTERVAVSRLSLDFEEGHISTLLGQNGAGKTTTIKVLTGQHPPMFGNVFVYGKNILNENAEFRKYLGYCPQYNTLYGKMTVKEHLSFFGNLKGIMSPAEVEEDVERMLGRMGLEHIQDQQACRLSGGLQRRLCVAFSFIGGSKLVILDEPTSSVDPMARRNIWNLILKYKHDRTILLTTHHMDEADVLSDKVAIIHKGRLLCDGSPLMLKSKFGCGYQLSLTRSGSEPNRDSDSGHSSNISRTSIDDDAADLQGILKVIRTVSPLAQVVSNHGAEVVISLPQRDPVTNTLYPFSRLISLLDERMLEFGFGSYGLSSTTLEEVFLSLCAVCDSEYSPLSVHSVQSLCQATMIKLFEKVDSKDIPSSEFDFKTSLGPGNALAGNALKRTQFKALVMKRFHHTISNWKAIFFSVVLPCVFIGLAMGFTLIAPSPTPEPPLRLTTQLYGPGAVSFISEQPPTRVSEKLLSPPGIGAPCLDNLYFGTHCSNVTRGTSTSTRMLNGVLKNTCGLSDASNQWDNVPRSVSVSSDVTYNITGQKISDYLLGTYPSFIEKRYGGWSFEEGRAKVWFDNTGYHSLPAYQNALSNALLRSLVDQFTPSAEASPIGITVYNHPLHLSPAQLGKETIMSHIAEVGIAIVVLMGLSFIPSRVAVYAVNERVRDEKQVQSISGVGPLLYWTVALIWDMGIVLATVSLSCVIIIIFGLPVYVSELNFPAVTLLMIMFGWGTIPLMYCLSRLFKESSISFVVLYCVNLFVGLNIAIAILVLRVLDKYHDVLSVVRKLALAFPQYALIEGLLSLAVNQIQADVYKQFGQDTYESPFSRFLLAYNYVAMFLVGVVFFCLNLAFEYNFHMGPWFRRKRRYTPRSNQDGDVVAEQVRTKGDAGKQDVLKVVDVVKVYNGRHVAVNDVSFGIPKGECFGLLGVNGAGKTTLFRILTGQLRPTHGDAFIQEMSLFKVFSNGIPLLGYCPQADALDDLLTPRQHLVVYAMLRGIPKSKIQLVVREALRRFQLMAHANHQVGTLSRGTRRKVCTAISMLGNPQIVLLDEPTSGMDPVTRRLVWANVSEAIRDKRSVLLTSHSMAECDLLCSRLAIMVNGKLCCIGSPQYLKDKFGAGYTVTIRMVENPAEWDTVIASICSHFHMATLKAHHCNVVEFSLPAKHASLSAIFQFLEVRGNEMGILDFSVSQTTLDQVFVNFARQQSDEFPANSVEDEVLTGISRTRSNFAKEELSRVEVILQNPSLIVEDDCEATKF